MRAYVGALIHETNAFSPVATDRSSYSAGVIGYRDVVAAAEAEGFDVIEGLSMRAAPSAPTRKGDYEFLRDQFVSDIVGHGEIDIVLLALHGAQVAEGYPDCEGDLLAKLRDAVGDTICIAVLLDLHASVSSAMLELADLVISIKEYPHTDYPESAAQLAQLARGIADNSLAPVTAFVPLPLYTLWHTPEMPCREIVDEARRREASGEVLHISMVHGFPWSDVPDAGAAIMVVTHQAPDTAAQVAAEFADKLWAIRDADLGHYRSIADCVTESVAINAAHRDGRQAGPLVIADASDNPGAGCGGDSTWLLQELLNAGAKRAAVAMLVDPATFAQAASAGVGSRIQVALGAHTGSLAGTPVEAEAEVMAHTAPASIDAMPGYPPIKVDGLVRLRIDDIDIVVSAYREQVFGPRVFSEVGLQPELLSVVVVKSAQHFYNAFAPMASAVLYADGPCSRSIDFSSLPFTQRRHPIWPLDTVTAIDIPKPLVFEATRRSQ